MLPSLPSESPAGGDAGARPKRRPAPRGFFFAAFLAVAIAALAWSWLAEEHRDLQAWADRATLARGIDTGPLEYLSYLSAIASAQWRAATEGHDWSPPIARWGAALAAILWMAGMEAIGFGLLSRYRRRFPESPAPAASLTLPLGFAAGGVAMLLVACAGLLQRPFVIALLAAGCSAGAWRIARLAVGWSARTAATRARISLEESEEEARPRSPWKHPLNVVVGVALLASLIYALAPATQSDGVRYHLGALGEWIKSGRLTFLPHMAFAQFPFLVEIHWLVGLAAFADPIAGGVFAQAIHWALFAWSLALLSDIASTLLGDRASAASHAFARRFARFAWATVPSAVILGGWCFIDHGIVVYFLASILALAWASDGASPGQAGRALIAGAILGGLLGTKYTMLAIGGLGGLWLVAATALRAPKGSGYVALALRAGVACALGAALIGGPWFAKNWALAGNPLYPATAGGLFASPGWSDEASALLASKMSRKGVIDYRAGADEWRSWRPGPHVAWATVATHWRSYEAQFLGIGFPLALLALFGMAALWRREAIDAARRVSRDALAAWCAALTLGAAFYALWALTYLSARMLLPLAALACAIPALVAARLAEGGERRAARVVVLAWSLLAAAHLGFVAHWLLAGASPAPLPVALGFEPEEAYLARGLNYHPLAASLNSLQEVPALGRVDEATPKALLLGEHRPYYFNGPILFSDWFDPPLIADLLREEGSAAALLNRLERDGIAWIGYNRAELSGYLESDLLPRLAPDAAREFLLLIDACDRCQSLPVPVAPGQRPGGLGLYRLADLRRALAGGEATTP